MQAYKFELMPSGCQARDMRRFVGSRRFVYNKALALQKERYAAGEKRLSYVETAKLLTGWRNGPETPWLKDAPSQSLQHALKDLDRAYVNFFQKRSAFPTFKKKGRGESFRFPQGFEVDQVNSRIKLPKLGWIRYRNSRDILGAAKNITISSNGGKWFASIQTEREIEAPIHPSASIVGIDVGIARFATLSDGSHIEPTNSFKQHQKRLARYQRRMSRKVKFSSNWKKAKAKVQKIHTRIAHIRRDFLHKTSTTICKNHVVVVVEDLQVRNMSKSAAGASDAPGKNVRQKSGLNRSILDQGWGEFRRQLEYKSGWLGGQVVAVNPRNTSRTCPCCGHVSADNRKTQERFACVDCGFEENADYVGAMNILAAGHAVLARGESAQSGHSVKQEPTEATQAVSA